MKKMHVSLIISFLLGALVVFGLARYAISQSKIAEFHEHADFALFLNGQRFDFTKEKYMSIEPCVAFIPSLFPSAHAHGDEADPNDLSEWVHLHGGVGSVIHVHRKGITYDNFFESIGMDFHNTYFLDDEGNRYEESTQKEFALFLNGERVETLADTPIRNLDRVLISYGNRNRSQNELNAEMGQIENLACVASEVCLHREPALPETCAVETHGFLERMLGL